MPKTYLNPSGLFPSRQYGFSQGVACRGGTTIYLSGQVAWDAHEQIGDPGDLGIQTQRALANIKTGLQAAGGTLDDIVSLRLFIVGEHIYNARPIKEALLDTFHPERLPASTWIGVAALADPEFLVEIEAVAVLE